MSKHIPGRPTAIVEKIRGAATLRAPEFLADAGRSKLDVDAIAGGQFGQVISGRFSPDAAAVAGLRERLR